MKALYYRLRRALFGCPCKIETVRIHGIERLVVIGICYEGCAERCPQFRQYAQSLRQA